MSPKHFLKRFWAGWELGFGLLNKIKAAFGLVLISRLSRLEFLMAMFGRQQKVVVKTGSDVAMWVEVFKDQEYFLPLDFKPKTILDLGANAGYASLYFKMRDPLAEVVAVEPDPHNLELLRENLKQIDGVKILEAAVSAGDGEEVFYVSPQQGMSSSFSRRPRSEEITVKTYKFDSLVESIGWKEVDLVKFDIEGAEWKVFEGAKVDLARVFIGEYHEDLTGKTVEEFIKLFPNHTSQIKRISSKRCIVTLTRKTV